MIFERFCPGLRGSLLDALTPLNVVTSSHHIVDGLVYLLDLSFFLGALSAVFLALLLLAFFDIGRGVVRWVRHAY